MKANVIFLMLLSALSLGAYAQDDDMYSFSSKKKEQGTSTSAAQKPVSASTLGEGDACADYHTGQLRDVDE